MRTAKSSRSWLLGPLSMVWALGGCTLSQGPAEKLIDPQLIAEGEALERERGGRDLGIGPYRVEGVERSHEDFDGSGPFAVEKDGRTRPTEQLRLRFALTGGAHAWTADCVGQRRQPPDHDLAAAADEARDEVAMRCSIRSEQAGPSGWTFEIHGALDDNLFGTLTPEGLEREDAQPEAFLQVEILMWHRVWKISRRPLPASLATVLGPGGTRAALILARPERAWLRAELDPAGRELAMITLMAVRLMPLGFEL